MNVNDVFASNNGRWEGFGYNWGSGDESALLNTYDTFDTVVFNLTLYMTWPTMAYAIWKVKKVEVVSEDLDEEDDSADADAADDYDQYY